MSLIFTSVVTALLLYRAGDWPKSWPPSTPLPQRASAIAAVIATALLLIAIAATLVNGRRWRLIREIVRLSNSSSMRDLMPDTSWTTQSARSPRIPQLVIDPVPRRLPRPGDLGPVSSRSNVTGRPPLRMAYLRLFENQPRARTFIQGAWREFGYVYLLRSANSVPPAEFRQLKRIGPAAAFIDSSAALSRELDRHAQPVPRGFRTFKNISAVTIRTWDRYGAYPPYAVLCRGSYWRRAVDELLLRVDAVLLDLSGFQPENEGTGYELQRVIDRFPIERVIFLADGRSDLDFLYRTVQEAWANMAAGSPNAGQHLRRTHLAVTDVFETRIQTDDQGREIQRRTRLVTSRRKSRRLAAWMQESIASAPPVQRQSWTSAAESESAPMPAAAMNSFTRRDRDGVAARWSMTSVVTLVLVGATVLGVVAGIAPRLLANDPIRTPAGSSTVGPDSSLVVLVVPDVRGQTAAAAVSNLTAAGFKTQIKTKDAAYPGGRVFDQSPAPGTRSAGGRMVTVWVSAVAKEKETRTVPLLAGSPLHQAIEALGGRGLRLGSLSRRPDRKPLDTVLQSTPHAGTTVEVGQVVDLVLASGQNRVPDVVGLPRADATRLVEEAGFEVVVTLRRTDSPPPGIVLEQSSRDLLPLTSRVVLVVAKAPPPTPTTSIPTPAPPPSSTPPPSSPPPPPPASTTGTAHG